MRRRTAPAILTAVAGLVLLWHAEGSGAQSLLATGEDAAVTADGLHRVNPLIMEAAWVEPDFDLSRYTRVLLMPTAVQFRAVRDRPDNARTRANIEEFPLSDDRKEWLRRLWREAVDERFANLRSDNIYDGDVSDVLVVQGFLVDVISRIPSESAGSHYTLVRDPWTATVVLELRDAATAELIARTLDQRNALGLLEADSVWYQTEDLVERWAQVLFDRLQQLSELGGRSRRTPD